MSYFNKIQTTPADSGAIDAFGRQRVSSLVTLFDGKLLDDSQANLWDDQEVSGSGTGSTYNVNQSSQTISVSTATAGTRTRQTFRHFGYQAGKSHLVMMTINFRGSITGITKEAGYFNDNNGVIFRVDGSGASIVLRSSTSGSPVENIVPQASWNVDKMDGTGPSGVTVDWSKVQILFIDMEWLGVGRVRTGLVINGQVYFIHFFQHANMIETVYMRTPNLPLRYTINNDGSGVTASLDCICATVAAEEGRQPVGVIRGIQSDATLGNLSTGAQHGLISLRLKSTHLDSIVQFVNFSAVSDSLESRVFSIGFNFNATIVNPTSWVPIANSPIEYMLGASDTTITGGRQTFISAATGRDTLTLDQQDNAILGSNIAGDSTVMTLFVEPLSAAMDIVASLNWRELA